MYWVQELPHWSLEHGGEAWKCALPCDGFSASGLYTSQMFLRFILFCSVFLSLGEKECKSGLELVFPLFHMEGRRLLPPRVGQFPSPTS